jgi:GNAT superfamily N-acetyltransferase
MQTHVRATTDADLSEVLAWLKAEDAQALEGCFWCNREVIRCSHGYGGLTVISEVPSGPPIGFCCLSGTEINILAIRHEFRGKGHGRRFARHIIEAAEQDGLPGLKCQCSPITSILFWESLGFVRVDPEEQCYRVALPFCRKHELPSGLPVKRIRIEVHHAYEDRLLAKSFESPATEDGTGTLILATQFAACVTEYDARLWVLVDGEQIHLKKLKYSECNGVERDAPWIMIREFSATKLGE